MAAVVTPSNLGADFEIGTRTPNKINLSLTGVSPNTYGSSSAVAMFTVDEAGRVVAAGSMAIAIGAAAVSGLALIATSGSASDLSSGAVPAARLTWATQAEIEAGTVTQKNVAPDMLRAAFGNYVEWPLYARFTGTVILGETTDSAGPGVVGLSTGAGPGSGVYGTVSGTGDGHGTYGAVTGNGIGSGVAGTVSGTGPGHGTYGIVVGNGNGSGAAGVVSGTGNGHGTYGVVSGNGAGSGAVGIVSGAGNGHGVVGIISGASSGNGSVGSITGPGNGNGGQFNVGGMATATGTGYALQANAHDVPGTGSHTRAVHGYVANPAAWAGYFDGAVFSSIGFTTSDARLKSDFRPIDKADAAALLSLPINTFIKHQNGQVKDKQDGERLERLRNEIEERRASIEIAERGRETLAAASTDDGAEPHAFTDAELVASIERDKAFISEAEAHIAAWDAEEWLPLRGDPMPGRLAGVTAQEVQAIAPGFVREIGDGTLVLNDTSVLYSMIAALKATADELIGMVKKLSEENAALSTRLAKVEGVVANSPTANANANANASAAKA